MAQRPRDRHEPGAHGAHHDAERRLQLALEDDAVDPRVEQGADVLWRVVREQEHDVRCLDRPSDHVGLGGCSAPVAGGEHHHVRPPLQPVEGEAAAAVLDVRREPLAPQRCRHPRYELWRAAHHRDRDVRGDPVQQRDVRRRRHSRGTSAPHAHLRLPATAW